MNRDFFKIRDPDSHQKKKSIDLELDSQIAE
jgi:hypothetical protein